jgi:hypothetical protein
MKVILGLARTFCLDYSPWQYLFSFCFTKIIKKGPEPVLKALDHLLGKSVVRPVIEAVYNEYGGVGRHATLYELNCFMSNPGARRQFVHADSVCLAPIQGLQSKAEPVMLTCFLPFGCLGRTQSNITTSSSKQESMKTAELEPKIRSCSRADRSLGRCQRGAALYSTLASCIAPVPTCTGATQTGLELCGMFRSKTPK